MNRQSDVRAWRDALRARDPGAAMAPLSASGGLAAWEAAWDALSDEALDAALAIDGAPFRTACVVAAGTVATAPIEWIAVLLARGTAVTLKHPADDPGVAPLLAEVARDLGLPLAITGDHDAIDADLVVAMGSDETIAEIRAAVPAHTRLLPHGHRFSAAWVTGHDRPADPRIPAGFGDAWGAVAADIAMFDTRGCLSPVVIATPFALDVALPSLAAAMARAAARWPTGAVDPAEGAGIRAREALAKVVGRVERGLGWSIHALPADHVVPQALPRSVAFVHCADATAAAALLARWGDHLSTVGTDDPASADAFVGAGATRVCGLGRMQRPPLIRTHDGEEWLRAVVRAVSREL